MTTLSVIYIPVYLQVAQGRKAAVGVLTSVHWRKLIKTPLASMLFGS